MTNLELKKEWEARIATYKSSGQSGTACSSIRMVEYFAQKRSNGRIMLPSYKVHQLTRSVMQKSCLNIVFLT